jgi:cytidine deaminase
MVMRDPSSVLAAALAARRAAYAPYSNFLVGAALIGRDGRLYTGANIENASFGLSMCAERVALYTAVSAGQRAFEAIAIAGPDGVTTMPCGACRQVLAEFNMGLRIIYVDHGQLKMTTLAQLLPEAFTPQVLNDASQTNVRGRGML